MMLKDTVILCAGSSGWVGDTTTPLARLALRNHILNLVGEYQLSAGDVGEVNDHQKVLDVAVEDGVEGVLI